MTPKEMLALKRAEFVAKITARNEVAAKLDELRGKEAVDPEAVTGLLEAKRAADIEINALDADVRNLELEIARDDLADDLAQRHTPTGAQAPVSAVQRVKVGAEESVYRADQDPTGKRFMRDVTNAFLGNTDARSRLERATSQLFDERAAKGTPVSQRAVGTANGSGFAIPEYLTDLFAPEAKEGAQLANSDNMTLHDLPESGMTAYIPRTATGTSADEQATQGAGVSETDFDDDLITVPIFTVAGAQSLRRQVLDRAPGMADEILKDLIGSYYTDLDDKAINRASTGLLAAGTVDAYTDASPTALELYSKILGSISNSEAVLKDRAIDDDVRVLMRKNRFRWLQNQFIDTHPFMAGRNVGAMGQGVSTGTVKGVRGYLPSDDPIVTDNHIPTNLGAGTNEDRIAVYAKSEAHLWLDPSAPMMIRAEQTQSKALTVDFVVYGYAATCFTRYPGVVRVIGGTGTITPTF